MATIWIWIHHLPNREMIWSSSMKMWSKNDFTFCHPVFSLFLSYFVSLFPKIETCIWDKKIKKAKQKLSLRLVNSWHTSNFKMNHIVIIILSTREFSQYCLDKRELVMHSWPWKQKWFFNSGIYGKRKIDKSLPCWFVNVHLKENHEKPHILCFREYYYQNNKN